MNPNPCGPRPQPRVFAALKTLFCCVPPRELSQQQLRRNLKTDHGTDLGTSPILVLLLYRPLLDKTRTAHQMLSNGGL